MKRFSINIPSHTHRAKVLIKSHVHRAGVSIQTLVQRYFLRFTSTAVAKTVRFRATMYKILYADRQAPRTVAASRGSTFKLAYERGTTATRARAVARDTAVKLIRARKAAVAVVSAKIPLAARIRWRLLSEIDEVLLGLLDDTILEDIDYISLDDVGKETDHE